MAIHPSLNTYIKSYESSYFSQNVIDYHKYYTTIFKTMADREECVYLAKLAEQAERYDEMVRRGRGWRHFDAFVLMVK